MERNKESQIRGIVSPHCAARNSRVQKFIGKERSYCVNIGAEELKQARQGTSSWRNPCLFIYLTGLPNIPSLLSPSPSVSVSFLSLSHTCGHFLSPYFAQFLSQHLSLSWVTFQRVYFIHLLVYCLYPHQAVTSMRSGDASVCAWQKSARHMVGTEIVESKNEPVHWTYIYPMPSV